MTSNRPKPISILAALLSLAMCLAPSPVQAEDDDDDDEESLTLAELPAVVRDTVLREAQGGTIQEIEREQKKRGTVYEVEIQKQGQVLEIQIAADGQVIKRKVEKDKGREPQ